MDENQFRAEIAEIFREQDRRFDRAQKRMEEMDKKIMELNSALDRTNANLDKITEIVADNSKSIKKNSRTIAGLADLWGDFVDTYRFREQKTERTLANLSAKISEIDNRTR